MDFKPYMEDVYSEFNFNQSEESRLKAQTYNILMNAYLHNHMAEYTLDALKTIQFCQRFHMQHFHLCLTGLKKDVYTSILGINTYDYLEIYRRIAKHIYGLLHQHGYHANLFLSTQNDSKQIVILFSSTDQTDCSAENLTSQIAGDVQRIYEQTILKGDRRYCNITSLVENLHGFEAIRMGYQQASKLCNLSFFRMQPELFTNAMLRLESIPVDYQTVMDLCDQLKARLTQGDETACVQTLSHLFLQVLKNSFRPALCQDSLSYCKHMLQIRCTAYGIQPAPEVLFELSHYIKIEECHGALLPFICQICVQTNLQGPYPNTVLLAISYIRQHYAQSIALPEIAQYAGVNANYLSNIFPEHTGVSVREYITRTRMAHSGWLLKNSAMRISEIAAAVGFQDGRYFTKLFKKYTSESPKNYRQRATEHT